MRSPHQQPVPPHAAYGVNQVSAPYRQRRIQPAPHVRIPFGRTLDEGAPVVWDSHTAINGHMLISGPSGTGKTYQLNRLIAGLARQGVPRIHVVNVHGDLTDGLPEHQVHTVRFTEQSPYGLQPLELLDDPSVGGVRRRALAFINLMARQGALGQRQRPALFRLLVEGYARFGFLPDDPRTWTLAYDPRGRKDLVKRYPTLLDLKESVWKRLVAMKLGQPGTTTAALEKVCVLARRRAQLRKRRDASDGEDLDKIEAALSKAREEASAAFAEAMDRMDTGCELEEFVHWDNVAGVQSLYDRLAALEMAGIFKGDPPSFPSETVVHDYDIKSLLQGEQQLFVDCLLERIYVGAKLRGESEGPVEFVVIDEADVFTTDDADHIVNKSVKELRKFGVGMVLAGQSFEHFPTDLLTSASVRLVLGCPELFLESTRRRLGLPMTRVDKKMVNPLSGIRPRETAFAGVASSGDPGAMVAIRLASSFRS